MAEIQTENPVFPLGSPLSEKGPYEAKKAYFGRLMEDLKARAAEVRRGGGERYIEREHARGKLTARERVVALIDEGSDFMETRATSPAR